MNNARTIIVSLVGLALSYGAARADLVTEFDLDGNGTKESSFSSSGGALPFTTYNVYSFSIKNGDTNKSYNVSWSDRTIVAQIDAASNADKPSIVHFSQISTLASNERFGDLKWKAGDDTIEKKVKAHVLAVDNAKLTDRLIQFDVHSGSGVGDLAARLVFTSKVKDGVIVHTVENKTDARLLVEWPGTGIQGKIDAGKTLTAERRAPNGATERKCTATFDPAGAGLGGGTIGVTVNFLAPVGGVPAPGPLALAGIGSLLAGRRRR